MKTIARVTRDASGIITKYKLPVEMPTLFGASSEFIPIINVSHYNNEVFKLDNFTADSTLVGYIYGGISSSAINIFFNNTGVESSVSSQIFKVYVIKNNALGVHELNEQSIGTLKMQVYPNPNRGYFAVKFNLKKIALTKITLYSLDGKKIEKNTLTNLNIGENTYHQKIKNLDQAGIYFLTIETLYEKATQKQKIIIKP